MKNKLSYFITRSSMFGIGFFLLFKYAGKDAWISVILGSILGLGIIYIYGFIKKYLKDTTLRDKLSQTFIGKIFLFIFILFYLYIIFIILILLPMFVNSFYLLYTPKIIIVIAFLILALYITQKDKSTLTNLSNLLFYISIFIILSYSLLLLKYIHFDNLLPIYTTETKNILLASLIYAAITAIPNILNINYQNNSFKDDLKNYLFGTLSTLFITILIIITLGEPLIKIYSFPEYDVFKQIKILDFIENVENLSTFIWYFDLFITLSSATQNLKDTLPPKYNKISFLILILLVIFLSTFLIGKNYRLIFLTFNSFAYILIAFFLIFTLLLLYLKITNKKKKDHQSRL